MEQDQQEVGQISKFNEANLQIMRLNTLWLQAEGYAKTGALLQWYFTLDSIWRELVPDIMKKDDDKKIRIKDLLLRKDINTYLSEGNRNKIYFLLNRRHEDLKLLQDLVGKGSVYESTDKEDFE